MRACCSKSPTSWSRLAWQQIRQKSSTTHYETLGIEEDANNKAVKAAYYKLSKDYHPDTTQIDKEFAAKQFQAISEAYLVLGSEDTRAEYDKKLGIGDTRRVPGTAFKPGDSFVDRHYPVEFEDHDYRHFVEFRRKWREKRRMQRVSESQQQWFWSHLDEEKREYSSSFYPPKPRYNVDDPFKKEQMERLEKLETELKNSEAKMEKPSFGFKGYHTMDTDTFKERRERLAKEQDKTKFGVVAIFGIGVLISSLLIGGR